MFLRPAPPPCSWSLMGSVESPWGWRRVSCPRMSVDILGTNCDQWVSMVQCCFTPIETVRLVRTEIPWRPPRLSRSSWTLLRVQVQLTSLLLISPPEALIRDRFCLYINHQSNWSVLRTAVGPTVDGRPRDAQLAGWLRGYLIGFQHGQWGIDPAQAIVPASPVGRDHVRLRSGRLTACSDHRHPTLVTSLLLITLSILVLRC